MFYDILFYCSGLYISQLHNLEQTTDLDLNGRRFHCFSPKKEWFIFAFKYIQSVRGGLLE